MNQEKINQIPWTEKISVRVNMIVSYQNGYYRSLTGKNDGLPPEGNQNWTYLGEISRYETVARRDAANITINDADAWRLALGLNGFDMDDFMKLIDWTNNGKIKADKIEALGLTTLIEVTQTSLASFAANSANYVFEQNDIIAIPDGTGNFALFIFKGGTKTVTSNYLPTGLTNITIAMVEGLQSALSLKVNTSDLPTLNVGSATKLQTARTFTLGNTSKTFDGSANVAWTLAEIGAQAALTNPITGTATSGQVAFFNGTTTQTGDNGLFWNNTNKRLGIGTTSPAEKLDVNGRIKSKAIVLQENSEALPYQITYENRKFYGTDSTGGKRMFQFADYQAWLDTVNGMTDAQKNEWKTAMNGGWTTNTMSVGAILPPVADNSDKNYWFALKGANLNFLSTSFKVEIMDSTGTTVVAEVPNAQVQLYANGTDLVFYYNLKNLPTGQYRLRLWNGVAYYTTGAVVSITIVSNLTAIPLGGLTWSSIQKTAGVADVVNGSGNAMNLNIKSANYALQNTGEIVGGLKSSQIVGANVNFYLKGNFTHFGGLNSIAGAIVGVGEDNPLTFANTNSAFVTGKGQADYVNGKFFLPGLSRQGVYYPNIFNGYGNTITNTEICEFIIIRNGNNASIIVSTNNTTAVSLQTITEGALHIFSYLLNGGESGSTTPTQSSIVLIEGYKF